MNVLKDAIFQLSGKLNLRTLEKLRERNINLCKTYEEPEFDKDGNYINKKLKHHHKNQDTSQNIGDNSNGDINMSGMIEDE